MCILTILSQLSFACRMEYPCSLKGLACTAVLRSKMLIPPHEIPITLQEDLHNLNLMVRLKKEEAILEEGMKYVEERLAHATYELLLFRNMLIDSPTDEEAWISYLQKNINKYSRIESMCQWEKARLTKEKSRRDGEEEKTLQKLLDFDRISVLVDMML